MKAKRSGVFAAIAVVMALTLSACGSDKEETMEAVAEETTEATTVGTIVDVASGAGNFGTLLAAVTAADLVILALLVTAAEIFGALLPFGLPLPLGVDVAGTLVTTILGR
mgnify:CR=1 FL=1